MVHYMQRHLKQEGVDALSYLRDVPTICRFGEFTMRHDLAVER